MKRNYLFEEIQPICTAISLASDSIEINSDDDLQKKFLFIESSVDEYLSEQKKGIVFNAVQKYGSWVRSKMIKAAKKGFKLEYC